ncbi:hypothetical protein, partial [Streptomyces sp. UNOC14_S4]|uniref:hypothetical protein n=1 Tax=Streptomyces sp. UNOC14_S4 TaxID=2872340 RepID=UPI001E62EAC6
MNAPGPGFAPPRRPSNATVITIRVVIVVLTVCTVGLFCWIPALRIAIMRRRAQDWTLFWATLAGSLFLISLMRDSLQGTVWPNVGMAALLILAAVMLTYYVRVDLRIHRELEGPPAMPGPAFPHPPMPQGAIPPAPATYGGYGYPPPQPYAHPQPQPYFPPQPPHPQQPY